MRTFAGPMTSDEPRGTGGLVRASGGMNRSGRERGGRGAWVGALALRVSVQASFGRNPQSMLNHACVFLVQPLFTSLSLQLL